MKKGVLLFILLIIIGVFVTPLFLPKQLKINSEKDYNKSISLVFEEFNDLKNFAEWNQLFKSDSTIKKEFFPPHKGKDARLRWESEIEKIGKGEIRIDESENNQSIIYKMIEDFGPSNIQIDFTENAPESTKVQWFYASDTLSYLYRYLTFFIKNQIQNNIDLSLVNLEEKLKNVNPTISIADELIPGVIQKVDFVGQKMVGIRNQTSNDPEEIKTAIQESLGTVKSFLLDKKKLDSESVGFPTVYWRMRDQVHNQNEIFCGFPVTQSVDINEDDGFELFVIPSSKTLLSLHEGNRDSLFVTYNSMKDFADKNNLKTGLTSWEVYTEEESEISKGQTKVYLSVSK